MSSEAARYRALSRRLKERKAEGKTFSLFGTEAGSDGYYTTVASLADRALVLLPDARALVTQIRQRASSKLRLRHAMAPRTSSDVLASVLSDAARSLSVYTRTAVSHLADISGSQRFDRTIAMSEPQYHLAMLEIELMNRANRPLFLRAGTRFGFIPHCLRDLNARCRAESDGIDEVCRSCSSVCWNNAISALLIAHGIRPYMWMTADLTRLFRRTMKKEGSLGVLGIACIPELVRGMRLCERHGIPVLGLPLNGNRCSRWMGQCHENSINLLQLEKLVS